MTNEETPFTEPVSPYFQVGIPGVPFSAIRAPLGTTEESMKEWAEWVATCAQIIANAYDRTFSAIGQNGAAPLAPPPPPSAPPAAGRGTGFYCPDHPDVEVIQSKAEYQTYDVGPNGEQIPAKFYCPQGPDGKRHSLWRSKLLTREQVEA